MAKGIVFYNNLLYAAVPPTIAVSTEAAGFEKAYLNDRDQGRVFRTTVITASTIKFSFAAAQEVFGITVFNHNLVAGDTQKKFQTSNNDFTDIIDDLDLVLGDGAAYYLAPAALNKQYYRLALTKASGTYIQQGEVFLFYDFYEFSENYNWDYAEIKERSWSRIDSGNGRISRNLLYKRSGFHLEFEKVPAAMKDKLNDILDSSYVVFAPDGVAGKFYFGVFENPSGAFSDKLNRWTGSIDFIESPA